MQQYHTPGSHKDLKSKTGTSPTALTLSVPGIIAPHLSISFWLTLWINWLKELITVGFEGSAWIATYKYLICMSTYRRQRHYEVSSASHYEIRSCIPFWYCSSISAALFTTYTPWVVPTMEGLGMAMPVNPGSRKDHSPVKEQWIMYYQPQHGKVSVSRCTTATTLGHWVTVSQMTQGNSITGLLFTHTCMQSARICRWQYKEILLCTA